VHQVNESSLGIIASFAGPRDCLLLPRLSPNQDAGGAHAEGRLQGSTSKILLYSTVSKQSRLHILEM
jgi:hypothetical protein